jgi:hypothetical protein
MSKDMDYGWRKERGELEGVGPFSTVSTYWYDIYT